MGGQGSEINEGKIVDAKAFDLLVYRISQLSCNGFAENYRAKNYNRPPKGEGRNRGNLSSALSSRGENLARKFCAKGGDLHSRLLLAISL